jgi:hypothetical protein
MTNTTWTVTIGNKTQKYVQDYGVSGGGVMLEGSTMMHKLPDFLAALDRMKAAGAVVVVGARS